MGVLTELRERMVEFETAEFDSPQQRAAAVSVWSLMSGAEKDSLRQMLFAVAPVWDGDHVSKMGRDALIRAGLATRCCYLGEQGYTVATYAAYSIFRCIALPDDLRDLQADAGRRHRNAAIQLVRKRWLYRWPWSKAKSLDALLQKAERT